MAKSTHVHHPGEEHVESVGEKLNWLRAGVLGANDGIVSVAGTIIGVAGATTNTVAIAASGIAALVAGAFSMAGGEYVSVSTQRDTEKAMLAKERQELKTMPREEFDELVGIYVDRGVSPEVAKLVARDLTEHDALRAHADAELGIDPDALTNPWAAAGSSFASFTVGALIPLIAMLLPLDQMVRIGVTIVAVAVALLLTGFVSATLGGARRGRAVVRNVGMGLLTMVVTYAVGALFGTAVGA
ncbi:VIT1/CCC1 transporter family protein [Pseudoclavibacter sp. 13-3]|uniref:VIT1/CCC1 transporter family protein n=1 Tax=Pseudoclavibacter sp. 13-3 TaxID=2901228 RepID=UPI001E467D91|nr:VIT family protein [Pseudoclavibacter sp. 13-3]MCD7102155.1 VIT family protein [Pseudoclavibacter sp. 13-3]